METPHSSGCTLSIQPMWLCFDFGTHQIQHWLHRHPQSPQSLHHNNCHLRSILPGIYHRFSMFANLEPFVRWPTVLPQHHRWTNHRPESILLVDEMMMKRWTVPHMMISFVRPIVVWSNRGSIQWLLVSLVLVLTIRNWFRRFEGLPQPWLKLNERKRGKQVKLDCDLNTVNTEHWFVRQNTSRAIDVLVVFCYLLELKLVVLKIIRHRVYVYLQKFVVFNCTLNVYVYQMGFYTSAALPDVCYCDLSKKKIYGKKWASDGCVQCDSRWMGLMEIRVSGTMDFGMFLIGKFINATTFTGIRFWFEAQRRQF